MPASTVPIEIHTPDGTVLVEVGPAGWTPVRWSDTMTSERAVEAVRQFQDEHGDDMASAPVCQVGAP